MNARHESLDGLVAPKFFELVQIVAYTAHSVHTSQTTPVHHQWGALASKYSGTGIDLAVYLEKKRWNVSSSLQET